jgi:hypothetical protein
MNTEQETMSAWEALMGEAHEEEVEEVEDIDDIVTEQEPGDDGSDEEGSDDDDEDRPPTDPKRELLRHTVRFGYDCQKLRIQASNRNRNDTAKLEKRHSLYLDFTGDALEQVERKTFNEVKRQLKDFKIYTDWLKHQRGCGPMMSAVLISEINIHNTPTISALWSYAGLRVDPETNQAVRRKRGEKANWNPFLKTKVVKVLGESFIKTRSPWREQFYDPYKHRKQNTLVPVCMACKGLGVAYGKPCTNCGGTGKNAPWGRSDAHRHAAAIRHMVKKFLREFWVQWRTMENLEVTAPYAVAVLGRQHGDHGGAGQSLLTDFQPRPPSP